LVVADLHHFDEEQDPDQHQSEQSDPDPQKEKRGIQVRITVFRIRNTVSKKELRTNDEEWPK
jgi:hypothetical protein